MGGLGEQSWVRSVLECVAGAIFGFAYIIKKKTGESYQVLGGIICMNVRSPVIQSAWMVRQHLKRSTTSQAVNGICAWFFLFNETDSMI